MDTRETLLAELTANGVRHTPGNVIAIGRDWQNRVVWLETGDSRSGFTHIQRHSDEFAANGIAAEDIPALLMEILLKGRIIGHTRADRPEQETRRPVFAWGRNDEVGHYAVTVGNNGYVVGAHPINLRKVILLEVDNAEND